MASDELKLVFGAVPINPDGGFSEPDIIHELYKVLRQNGVDNIDTAQLYTGSEELLGKTGAGAQFTIDTKHFGGFKRGCSTKIETLRLAEESLKKLRVDNVDVFYIHAPDPDVPITETYEAFNELHQAGKFNRFGLSNFTPDQVKEVIRISHEKDYVPPTVYQGNYNAIARSHEDDLFPLLRENHIAYYAYSPIAGGFLTKSREQFEQKTLSGRWDPNVGIGKMYGSLYGAPEMLDVLDKWGVIADKSGVSKAELAYRWVTYHSALKSDLGDALIIGSRSIEQTRETLKWVRNGPLDASAVKSIGEIWEIVKHVAPVDNYQSYASKQDN